MGAQTVLDEHAAIRRAVEALCEADALLVCTGAGMGVDSGLATFRGRHAGVWPPLEALEIDYAGICSPTWFETDPRLAWAFWHHCYQAYTRGTPHEGYSILSRWGSALRHGLFSVTSNVDGHWLRTPGVHWSRVYEVHGAVTHMQGLRGDSDVWPAEKASTDALQVPRWGLQPGDGVQAQVDVQVAGNWRLTWVPAVLSKSGRCLQPSGQALSGAPHAVRRRGGPDLCRVVASSNLPQGVRGEPARPNVMMFGDTHFSRKRVEVQRRAFEAWTLSLPEEAKLVILEVGAGNTVSTIRELAEATASSFPQATLVRINLDDGEAPASLGRRGVSIGGLTALEALAHLDRVLAHAPRAARRTFSAPPGSTRSPGRAGRAGGSAAQSASPRPSNRRGPSRGILAMLAELQRARREVVPLVLGKDSVSRGAGKELGEAGLRLCTDPGGMPRGACQDCEGCASFALGGRTSVELLPEDAGEDRSSEEDEEGEEDDGGAWAPCERCRCPAQRHVALRNWLRRLRALAQSFPSRRVPARCTLPAEAADWTPERAFDHVLQRGQKG